MLEEVGVWIENFYEQGGKLDNFDRYGFVFNVVAHFQTNTFEYIVDGRPVRSFFEFGLWTMAVLLLISILDNLGHHEGFNLMVPLILVFSWVGSITGPDQSGRVSLRMPSTMPSALPVFFTFPPMRLVY